MNYDFQTTAVYLQFVICSLQFVGESVDVAHNFIKY